MTTVIVHPEPADAVRELAVELLALADRALDVEYVMWPEPGFRVPETLFEKFADQRRKAQDVQEETPTESELEEVEPETPTESEPEEVKPVKRAPGRPKKNVEGQ